MKKSLFLTSPRFIIASLLFAFSLASFVAARRSAAAAVRINKYIGGFVRSAPLPVSNLFGFSLFELLAVFSPFLVFFVVLYSLRRFEDRRERRRRLLSLVALLLVFISLYLLTLGVGYSALGGIAPASPDSLRSAARLLAQKVAASLPERAISLEASAASLYRGFSLLHDQRLTLTASVPRPKRLRAVAAASRLRILALYSFVTGEININVAAPHYVRLFSVAHEMAHLFGVADEAAADLFAFRAALESGEPALVYSAYLTAFEAVLAELAPLDRALYRELWLALSPAARADLCAHRTFGQNGAGAAGSASDRLNEAVVGTVGSPSSGYSAFVPLLISHLEACGELASTKTVSPSPSSE